MEKPNFQRETEKAIERLCVVSRPPLLLRTSCDGQLGFDDLL